MMDGEDSDDSEPSSPSTQGCGGIPVGTCRTSFVTPEDGVHYVGYPIEDLVDLDPMDVIHLLFEKDLPDPEQSHAFRRNLLSRSTPPKRSPRSSSACQVMHTRWMCSLWECRRWGWVEPQVIEGGCARSCRWHAGTHRTHPQGSRGAHWPCVPIPDHDQGLVERFIHMYDLPVTSIAGSYASSVPSSSCTWTMVEESLHLHREGRRQWTRHRLCFDGGGHEHVERASPRACEPILS